MTFETASHRGLTDADVHAQPVGWLFSQYEMVLRDQWATWTGMVTATEVGLSRVLAVAVSDKGAKPKPLPTWEQISGQPTARSSTAPPRHSFADRLERANAINRAAQVETLTDGNAD